MTAPLANLAQNVRSETSADTSNLTESKLLLTLKAIAAAPKRPDNPLIITHCYPDISESLHKSLQIQVEELRHALSAELLNPAKSAERLRLLREAMQKAEIDAFLIPLNDEFHGEASPMAMDRLKWLTGFTGSAGFAAVMQEQAAIFVDGRYTLQVRNEVDEKLFAPCHVSDEPLSDWLTEHLKPGMKLGLDPWLHTEASYKHLKTVAEKAGSTLKLVEENPIDTVWEGRPPRPMTRILPHSEKFSGEKSTKKREKIALKLKNNQVDAVLHTLPDVVCWLLNVRGMDLPCTPFVLSQAITHADGSVDWFIEGAKLTPELEATLDSNVRINAPDSLADYLSSLSGKTVQIDPTVTSQWFIEKLTDAGAHIVRSNDPCMLPKAAKNEIEVEGMRRAHIRDGAAMTKFLHWLDTEAQDGHKTELDAEAKLYSFRAMGNDFQDISFNTISGAGPNGAIVHYRANEESNRALQPGTLYLVDSGGQYLDGTTDITRTVAIGAPSAEMKNRFTLVLKGHIALSQAIFPKRSNGSQLDTLARQFLWQQGLDYDHGTGHGVGSYLSVHEGPQRISKMPRTVPLEVGMVLSNEPGYYKTGEYGIRIENLVTVIEAAKPEGSEREILQFENLTFAPIDKRLVDQSIMTADEIHWLNEYHSDVWQKISPLVEGNVKSWLKEATAPL